MYQQVAVKNSYETEDYSQKASCPCIFRLFSLCANFGILFLFMDSLIIRNPYFGLRGL